MDTKELNKAGITINHKKVYRLDERTQSEMYKIHTQNT